MTNKERLNSNIYKSIFPEDVIDLEYIEDIKTKVISSYNEIKYPNHGFEVNDVIMFHQRHEQQFVDIYKDVYEDVFENCPNLTPLSITLSYSNNGYLSGGNATVTATITGGTDAWGRNVTKTISCNGNPTYTKISDTQYNLVFSQAGVFTLTVTAKSAVSSLPTVTAVKTITIKNTDGSTTSSGSFSGTAFASDWMNTTVTPGCYINSYEFKLKIRSGHGSYSDTMYILGKKSDGSIVIVRDAFNTSRMLAYPANSPKTGNLSSTQWTLTGTLTLANDIRQIAFYANSPGHSTCVTGAAISYSMNMTFNDSLYSSDVSSGVTSPTGTTSTSWVIIGTSSDLSTKRKIGERYVRTDYVRTDKTKDTFISEYVKAIASPEFVNSDTSNKFGNTTDVLFEEYKIVGIVTTVKNKDIFAFTDVGQLDWPYLNFDDTTVLYLSDKIPGKTCHYKEIDNLTYIPIAIYTDRSIIINILNGVTGAPLAPYEKKTESVSAFARYTQAELDSVAPAVWGVS